jgi:uncharacterized membrane protein
LQPKMGTLERSACAMAGGALMFTGLQKGRSWGLLMAGLGVELFRRGISGQCYLYDKMARTSRRASDDELVDRMSEESFPASDAPATY